MEDDHRTPNAPIVKDIRAYYQKSDKITDEQSVLQSRDTKFLNEQDEKWYKQIYAKYYKEFGFDKKQD